MFRFNFLLMPHAFPSVENKLWLYFCCHSSASDRAVKRAQQAAGFYVLHRAVQKPASGGSV